MKAPALVAVDAGPEAFAALFAAARERGVRVGWLDLAPPPPVAGALERAAAEGALRAVAVGGGRSLALKPVHGEPVVRDLLREHFLGCAIVLVRGLDGHPRLTPAPSDGERYRLETSGGPARTLDPPAALAELLRPVHRF